MANRLMKNNTLGGWKTWLAVAGLVLLGLSDVVGGDVEAALAKFSAALGLIGLGQKIGGNDDKEDTNA